MIKLMRKGIPPTHPRFRNYAEELEARSKKDQQQRLKDNLTMGRQRILHITEPAKLAAWLGSSSDGRAIRLGVISSLEIWKRGEELILAVENPHWQVYRIQYNGLFYVLRHKLA